jgi:hypothetical protein
MKRTSFPALTILLSMVVVGCAQIGRSPESGYAFREDSHQGRDRRTVDREAAVNSLGYRDGQDFNGNQRDAITMRASLLKAERAIEGKREREQYFKNKAYFRSDRERLEFLRLPSYAERARFLEARGIQGSATKHPPEIQELIDMNDITVGMTKAAVRDAWGAPEVVEVAGNPIYGNERWTYTEQIASQEGFHGEVRVVHFESGRVVGWETR